MEEQRVFLDTSVLLNWILDRSMEAKRVMTGPFLLRYTNEYALKEVYWVLSDKREYSEQDIADIQEIIRNCCVVLSTPRKEEFRKIRIQDKSDRPIVYSAMKHDLVLIDDERTFQDAKEYVKVRRIPKNKL